ncbi:MAG: L7Ae/L30e/S12e/Gadd45 family ribosomal protein [Anaerofustis sp.]
MASELEKIRENPFVVGTKQTLKAVKNGIAVTVFLAEDASDYMRNQVSEVCGKYGMSVEHVSTMEQLGNSCGISRGAVTAAIIKKII